MKIPIIEAEKPEKPAWGVENPYNSRALIHNWYEDRRQFQQNCSRCTGYSIYKTDYAAHHAEDYTKSKCVPPREFEYHQRAAGDGPSLLMNTQDYCEYLRNYTTTYDLMYNWDVRRAGVKPKPWRKWKLVADALWVPQPDNTFSFGNLTQFGYRAAPQLPMVPNDWKTYDMGTTYKQHYVPQRYPDAYTLCRAAAPKCVRREIDDLVLAKKPNTCDCCQFCLPKHPKDNDNCIFPSNHCRSYTFQPNLPRVHPTLVPGHTLHSKEPVQALFPSSRFNYNQLKHPPHPKPIPGEPILESIGPDGPCDTREICNQVFQDMNDEARATCGVGQA